MRVERAWNPIALVDDPVVIDCPDWLSPNQLIAMNKLEFRRPFMCMVNGQFWSRKDWDIVVPAGGIVRFVELPTGGGGSNPLKIIATIAIMAAAAFVPAALGLTGTLAGSLISAGIMVAGSLLLNMLFPAEIPNASGSDYGTPKTIYSVSSSSNRLRIGEPFAEHFGRMICYPDLIQTSYTQYIDNEQYLFFYGIIGVGTYEIEGVFIDKTLASDYSEATYNILEPGHIPSLIPDVVWTSAAISGQELTTTYLTAIVSGRGTEALYIEYDVQFNQLIAYNDNGDKISASVTTLAQVRLVDLYGLPTGDGSWTDLHQRTYSASSKDPLRYSNKIPSPLGPGRYEFRIKRTTEASQESQVADRIAITGLKAYGGPHPTYSGITTIEAKIKATNQLNGDVSNRINVVATRKLGAVTSTGFDSTPAASRSIIDAIGYICSSTNGAGQPDEFFRFDYLAALRTKLEDTENHHFDYRFQSRTTVMEACNKAAKCGRSVPYMPGGMLGVARDEYQELPRMVFTEDDYDKDTLAITSTFKTEDSPTYVVVKYLDKETWQDDSVEYYDEQGSDSIPYEITLDGCTERQQAYDIAFFSYQDMMKSSVSVEFSTGLKGNLPSLFDKIALSFRSTDWGQTGKIVAVDDTYIWLSEPVDFHSGSTGQIYITTPAGDSEGPYDVDKDNTNPYRVVGSIDGLKTLIDNDIRATSYMFGPSIEEPFFIRLMGIRPNGRNKIRLFGTIADDSIYDSAGTVADPGSYVPSSTPLISVLISYKGLDELGDNEFSVLWIGSAVEWKIELDEGSGYSTLEDNYTSYQKTFTTSANDISVKVTPYLDETLSTEDAIEATYTVTPAPSNLTLDSADADSVEVSWDAVTDADHYEVSVYVDDVKEGSRIVLTESASVTTTELSAMGGPWPIFDVHVNATIGTETGQDATLEVEIPAMSAPTGLALQSILSNGVMLSWNATTGATGYKLYVGTTSGFDPSTEGTLCYAGSSLSAVAVVDVTSPYDHFFKVAGTNGYYQDPADLVFSSALEVAG